jgi:hypothetical protein
VPIKFTLAAIVLLTACAPRSMPVRTPDLVARVSREQSAGWVTLSEGMTLKIESAYFQEGAAKRDISTYIGIESQTLETRSNGQLRPTALTTLPSRPPSQPAVSTLLPVPQQSLRSHRFFFQVAMDKATGKASAVLLSARSNAEMESLATTLLQNPSSVCRSNSPNCTVFPEGSAVSLGAAITLNGKPATIAWGSTLGSVVGQHRPFTIQRRNRMRIDANDPQALRLPILPGDAIAW